MRGPLSWGMAVRRPDSTIVSESFDLPRTPEKHRWLKWPFFRGVYILVEQLRIGMRALRMSANYQLDEPERLSDKQMSWTMGTAIIVFAAIFIALPAVAAKFGGRWIGIDSALIQNIVEGAIRIGFFVGYILLISMLPDIKRVFQYHGAEHKTIYAYENDDPMKPEIIDRYSTLHVRCGTNFLFILLFLTILIHLVLDLTLPTTALRLTARVLIIPLLAGIAYEVIKAASKRGDSLIFKIVSLPGLAFQKITTRPPTHDQIEVAIAAMETVIARENLDTAGA